MTTLNTLQKNLGHHFKNPRFLSIALTHRSKQRHQNNERLEFLGDSVLSLIISTEIYRRHPQLHEGELSCLRAALVKGETIAKIAFELGIGECMQLGMGESKSGGYQRESILAGAFESMIGAIYCDAGFETVQACVLSWYGDVIDRIDDWTDVKDAKTRLQEWLQAKQMALPVYNCVASGDAHAMHFHVTCHVDQFSFETFGESSGRRRAEQIAAKEFLKRLK